MASNGKVATGSAAASTFNGKDVAAHFRQTWSAALADKPEMFRAPGGPGGAWGGAGSNAWSKPAGGAASHQSAMADGQQFLVGLSKAADHHNKSSTGAKEWRQCTFTTATPTPAHIQHRSIPRVRRRCVDVYNNEAGFQSAQSQAGQPPSHPTELISIGDGPKQMVRGYGPLAKVSTVPAKHFTGRDAAWIEYLGDHAESFARLCFDISMRRDSILDAKKSAPREELMDGLRQDLKELPPM